MNFQEFEVTPVGNAELSIMENKLKVSNIGDSGLDGDKDITLIEDLQ